MTVARKLAAILAADVAGYSRLMAVDEAGTLARFNALKAEVIQPKISQYGGIVVGSAGDSLLVEFASVVDAVQCAVETQERIAERNAEEPQDRCIVFRMGVNLGDVIAEGGTIHGDGVNVASRLEKLADPGSVVIARAVHDQVKGKLAYAFTYLGEQHVKNIADPVRAYRIETAVTRNIKSLTSSSPDPSPPLPDKPSIAVLPFANMSGDPDQEFFADGIAEDIITELSRFHSLFVIARNSSFTFKGQSVAVKAVARQLGARYVVEGSVRKAGNRVRVTAQLIDAVEDKHLWAERYDRALDDIFAVQDEITRAIVTTIEPHLASVERQRSRRKPTESLGAWECYQRALWHLYQNSADDTRIALGLTQRAIELDPTFSSVYAARAVVLYYGVIFGYSRDRDADLAAGLEAGRSAVMLDESNPFAHVALARIHTVRGEHEAAIAACDVAIGLNPNFASAYFGRAHSLWHAGRAAEAIPSHDEAIRLSPRDPLMWSTLASKAIALVMLGRYDEAIEWSRRAQQQPNAAIFAHAAELCALGLLGRHEEAQAAAERARRVESNLSVGFFERALPITSTKDREHFLLGLAKAGLIP